ncbi:MAG: hypothetical protein HYV63_08525 [Candidatus Schekmanbacteria bacterium]|nr:hypothetical protein [Candidatus Schekmanbacteria bacterium]
MPMADYELLARLFAQPGAAYATDVTGAAAACREHYPVAAALLQRFRDLLPPDDHLALQELHTRTFDVQAITSLDIGYALFGEDYKRGALLANLSAEHKRAGIECGEELADHLTNVLRLLSKMADHALREELVRVLLAPAVREMMLDFEEKRLTAKDELYKKHHKTLIDTAAGERRTAYRHALEALLEVLRIDFALPASPPIAPPTRVASALDAEMEIEDRRPCDANSS